MSGATDVVFADVANALIVERLSNCVIPAIARGAARSTFIREISRACGATSSRRRREAR